MAVGMTSKPPAAKPKRKQKRGDPNALAGLNKQQNQMIQQRTQSDIALGDAANGMLPGVTGSYSQPFDWSQLPSAPVSGDFNAWRDQQLQQGNQAFDARMNPLFKQQSDDFEQQMANRGIPMGSELYNREKSRMEQSQNDARQQGYYQAAQTAGQNAEQFFGVGSQARGTALNEGMMQRNMPLNEYNAMMAARSPMDMANLGYSQQKQLQGQGEANQRWLMQNQPRGGGGGGGGGGTPPIWQQWGASSPQDYAAQQEAIRRNNQQWEWDNSPQYRQPSGPSYGAALGGGVLGSVLGGWASSGFKGIL